MAAATHPERSLSSVCPGMALGYHLSIALSTWSRTLKACCPHWHPCPCLHGSSAGFVSHRLSAMALLTGTLCSRPLPCQGACLLCMSMCPASWLHPLCMSACWLLSEAHLTDTVLRALLHRSPCPLCVLHAWLLTCVPLVLPLGPPPLQRAASFSPMSSQQTLDWDNQQTPCHPVSLIIPLCRRFEIQCREESLLFLVWVLSLP